MGAKGAAKVVGLEWHDGLATGDEVIDRQHREICELTKELIRVVDRGDDDPFMTEELLYGLMRYVLVHFADEEALMERVGYPRLARQRMEHEQYRTRAASMTAGFLEHEVSASTVLEYMLEWWHDHICREDLELAEYVRARSPRGYDA